MSARSCRAFRIAIVAFLGGSRLGSWLAPKIHFRASSPRNLSSLSSVPIQRVFPLSKLARFWSSRKAESWVYLPPLLSLFLVM